MIVETGEQTVESERRFAPLTNLFTSRSPLSTILAIIFVFSSCTPITFQQISQTSELPLSSYKNVCFEFTNIPLEVQPVIDSELSAAGLRRVSFLEVRDGNNEIKSQTLRGLWQVVGRTTKIIGFSQTVKVTLLDPFGRGFVYEGIGEHMGNLQIDDLIGATSAALADLKTIPRTPSPYAESKATPPMEINYWYRPPPSNPPISAIPSPLSTIPPAPRSFRSGGGSHIEYEIEAASNDEVFIIEGEVFKAKTWCLGWDEGDRVIFLDGDAGGGCFSATIFNADRRESCEVWCE